MLNAIPASDALITLDEARDLVSEFASQGVHRTGWPADDAASRWLCDCLGRQQVAAHIDRFEFPRPRQAAAFVQWNGHHIEGVVLHDGGRTPPLGVIGPLVANGTATAGRIQLLDPGSLADPIELVSRAGGPPPAAVIVLAGDPQGEIVLRNAEHLAMPRALPVLQIAGRHADALMNAAAHGSTVRVVVDHQLTQDLGSNVVGDVATPGADRWIVVMTPKSGWYGCAAERGGGLVIALALARAAARLRNRRFHVRFLFTSGHELGHWGLRTYLDAHPELRLQTRLWIHLGASIGARYPTPGMPIVYSRQPALRAAFEQDLQRSMAAAVTIAPPERRPPGEAREVFDHPFVSMGGGHRYFHSPQDTPAIAADPASVLRYAAAFHELLERELTTADAQ